VITTEATNKDLDEAIKAVAADARDPQAMQRLRAEPDAFRSEMRKQYGDRDIAVPQ
jgi:hypothetical protein